MTSEVGIEYLVLHNNYESLRCHLMTDMEFQIISVKTRGAGRKCRPERTQTQEQYPRHGHKWIKTFGICTAAWENKFST
jgi:hypothetical protein